MGVEITDICMDREQGEPAIYSNSNSANLKPPEILDSYGNIKGDHECLASEESNEMKEYEVKECTDEKPVKGEEEQTVESLKEKLKLEARKGKDDGKLISSTKNETRHIVGGARTKHTVPQPFALATAKRASSGARPTGTDFDSAIAIDIKSPSRKPVHKPRFKKLNQVTSTN